MAKDKTVAGVHFYVQPLVKDGRRLVPGQMREARDEPAARKLVGELAERCPGVVAYSVELDAEGDLIGEASIIMSKGRVPGLEVDQDVDAA